MGDSGSLIIGFVLSSIALFGNWKSYGLMTSLAVPILVLGYPIFDTTLVSIIRIIERRSVFQGGRDHSSHRLALLGLKAKGAVLTIYGICCLLGIAAFLDSIFVFKISKWIVLAAFVSMLFLGIRLSFVRTGRFGRKKGVGNG